ncbi:MAG: A24 family peptidase [Pseudomonadota bacterium]|nr:A24 family peptidase [Pseudomonadota bacterium]
MVQLLSDSTPVLTGVVFLFGLLVGSFLNVVIHRVPVMLERAWRRECLALDGKEPAAEAPYNLVVPRSACPSCKAPITALQNIPVVSWLLLKGKCKACSTRISARYPLVEVLTALMSAAVAWKFGFSWSLAAALVLTWFLVALAFIDIDTQLLPDSLTLPLLWLGLLLAVVLPAIDGARLPVDLRSAVIGAIAGYLSLWSVYHLFRLLTGKEGMGFGDFKLLAALGAWLGWQMLLPIIIGAAGVGAVVGIVAILLKARDKGVPMAFGPYLAAAGWLVLMFGPQMVGAYLGLYAPH